MISRQIKRNVNMITMYPVLVIIVMISLLKKIIDLQKNNFKQYFLIVVSDLNKSRINKIYLMITIKMTTRLSNLLLSQIKTNFSYQNSPNNLVLLTNLLLLLLDHITPEIL